MNRELKFRVWDIEYKEMLYNCENMISSFGKLYCNYRVGAIKAWPDKTYEIMQFTGLLDKNKKEIYEGDIVEYIDSDIREDIKINYFQGEYYAEDGSDPFMKTVRRFLIKPDKSNFFKREYIDWVKTNSGPDDGKPVDGLLNGGDSINWTVIGNIFETPELLK